MKKIPYWAAVVALLIAAAPSAFADHCERCRSAPPPFECVPVLVRPGQTECIADADSCWTSGIQCSPHSGRLALAAEYTVASVERLDEPGSPAEGARVARLAETKPSR
ncbi:MAG TPA: hypothetical protein VFP80_01725 [Thermoanaerobaculia bacterium]|nr:hypothetical protein [Thermoanaerobaculia bacterium]